MRIGAVRLRPGTSVLGAVEHRPEHRPEHRECAQPEVAAEKSVAVFSVRVLPRQLTSRRKSGWRPWRPRRL